MVEPTEELLAAQQALREQLAYHRERGEMSLAAYIDGVSMASGEIDAMFAHQDYVIENARNAEGEFIYKNSFVGNLPLDYIGGSLPPIRGEDFESWVRVMFEDVPDQGQFLVDWVMKEGGVYPESPKERVAVRLYDRLIGSYFTPSLTESDLGTLSYSDAVRDYTLTDKEYASVLDKAGVQTQSIFLEDGKTYSYDETLGDWGARIVMLAGGALQGMSDIDGISAAMPTRHTQEELQLVMSDLAEYTTILQGAESNPALRHEIDVNALKADENLLFDDLTLADQVFDALLSTVEGVCGTPQSIPNLVAANGVKIR